MGIKGYQVVHFHAQNALTHVKSRLKQIVGSKGSYSFSDAHINWLTQSVVIKDVKLSLSDNTIITMRKVTVTPKDVGSVTFLNIEDVSVKSSFLSSMIASVSFNNLTVPAFLKKENMSEISWSDIGNISFEQGEVKGAYFYTKWGKLRLGSWRIAREGSAKKRPYLFHNVDIAPTVKVGQSVSLDAFHFDQLIWEMSNDNKFNDKEFVSSFFTSNNYLFKANGIIGFRAHQKRLLMGQLNIHLSRQEETWDGEVSADKLDYNLVSSFSIFAEYLKRLGYEHINGEFHSDFTYYTKDSLLSLHKLNYIGYNFVGFDLQSRFYVDQKIFNPTSIKWSESILLKSMVLSVYDTGLKKNIFSILARNSNKIETQVYDDTLRKFIEFSKGKDFDLDRQLYTALTDILQHPNHIMQFSIVFDIPERVSYLLNMNFIDFFKLINQNNMTITAIPKN